MVNREITLASDIQTGEVCCFSMISVIFEYHAASFVPSASKLKVVVKMCDQVLSSFWHCSSSFLDGMWDFLQ